MRKRYRLKKKFKVILAIIFLLILLFAIKGIKSRHIKAKHIGQVQITKKEEKPAKKEINSVSEPVEENKEEIVQEVQEANIQENESYEKTRSANELYTTRMTSFWANDGYGTGECTGSGLCSWDFQVNDKGWYTYNGKLVVATATTYLANQGWFVADGVHLYKYWEELILTIDGIEYEAIILDSCGSSMKTDRVDLFVSNGSSVKDTTIQVRRK